MNLNLKRNVLICKSTHRLASYIDFYLLNGNSDAVANTREFDWKSVTLFTSSVIERFVDESQFNKISL